MENNNFNSDNNNEMNLNPQPETKIIYGENPDNNIQNNNQNQNIDIENFEMQKNFNNPNLSIYPNIMTTAEGLKNNLPPQIENVPDSSKIPNIHGEKTIVCWNCLSVLMVKDEWSVVKCTNCGKINRVPGTEDNIESAVRLNDNMNHFDLYVPYVYAVITCPFCQTENKVRKDAEHVVCFQCHNSYNIQKEPWENYANAKNNNKEFPQVEQPPIVNTNNTHSCDETQKLLKKLIKQLEKQPKFLPMPKGPNKYKTLRQLVRDVDNIDEKRMINRQRLNLINNRGFEFDKEYIGNIDKKFNPIKFNENQYNNDVRKLIGDNNLFEGNNEMERLKKKLYDEIRNDDKYRRIYKPSFSMKIDNNRNGYNRPLSYNKYNDNYYNNRNYYVNKPRNDVVYKMMFNPNEKNLMRKSGNSFFLLNNDNDEITKGEGNINKIYGGLEFKN